MSKSIIPAAIISTQTVFTNMLRDAITARGFDFAVDFNYSNTGSFRARHGGTLEQVLEVSFSFQLSGSSGYASFTIGSARGHEELPCTRAAELQSALDKILAHLPAPKIRAARKSAKALRAANRERHEQRVKEGTACPTSCVVCGGAS